MVSAHLSRIAVAVPASIPQHAMWDQCFSRRYRTLAGASRIWNGAGVETRHAVIDPRTEDISSWSTGARMKRYVTDAVPLAVTAVSEATKHISRRRGKRRRIIVLLLLLLLQLL